LKKEYSKIHNGAAMVGIYQVCLIPRWSVDAAIIGLLTPSY